MNTVTETTFDRFAREAKHMGSMHAASEPLVRSSYRADRQARNAGVV
ncbi:MAG: hypothetical protein ACRET1_09445 [Burkholderiales bacterium]